MCVIGTCLLQKKKKERENWDVCLGDSVGVPDDHLSTILQWTDSSQALSAMDDDMRRGRGVGRGHGHALGHSVTRTGSEIGQGRGRGRGRGQETAGPGQGQRDVGHGAGQSSSIVGLAASHRNNNAARAPPIPRSLPLLSQQEGHKSAAVLSGHILKPLFVRKHKIKMQWFQQIRDYVVNAGFYGLYQIGYVRSDKFLISALVERWRPETHSFHLPFGEMMVTLQDVGVLLGLPIDGEPICIPENIQQDWPRMIRAYLGLEVDDETFFNKSKTSIRITWLKRQFRERPLDPQASEHEVQCYARGYILMLIGSLLFTNISGGSISAKYLLFLTDLSRTGKYSWGSAVLAYLNKELCRLCRKNARQMGGPILLLQIWAWERFHLGRPKVRDGVPKPRLGGSVVERRPPCGYLWSGYHDWTENPARVLSYYRDELDKLMQYQVNWKPYNKKLLTLLPPICTSARDLWMYTGPVIHFDIVEPHNPRRVMRQFGKHQEVPPNPSRTFNSLPCSYQDKQKKRVIPNWKPDHKEDIIKWRQRRRTILQESREYDPSTYGDYMKWYSVNTKLYLQPAKAIGPLSCNPRSLQYQIRAGNTHKAAEKIKYLRKTAAKKMAEAVDEGTKAFAQKMVTGLKDLLDILGEYDGSSEQLPAQCQAHMPRQQQEQWQQHVGGSSSGAERRRLKRPRVG